MAVEGANDVLNEHAGEGARVRDGVEERNCAYWSFVTSVESMQNDPTATSAAPTTATHGGGAVSVPASLGGDESARASAGEPSVVEPSVGVVPSSGVVPSFGGLVSA